MCVHACIFVCLAVSHFSFLLFNCCFVLSFSNSLSAIASKRPAFYGRILPVLLGLDPSSSSGKGVHHALKSAFLSCLNCTHPGAVPWRDRLIDALRELKAVGVAEHAAIELASQNSGSLERKNDSLITQVCVLLAVAVFDYS